jgi:hypothetical protein
MLVSYYKNKKSKTTSTQSNTKTMSRNVSELLQEQYKHNEECLKNTKWSANQLLQEQKEHDKENTSNTKSMMTTQ